MKQFKALNEHNIDKLSLDDIDINDSHSNAIDNLQESLSYYEDYRGILSSTDAKYYKTHSHKYYSSSERDKMSEKQQDKMEGIEHKIMEGVSNKIGDELDTQWKNFKKQNKGKVGFIDDIEKGFEKYLDTHYFR